MRRCYDDLVSELITALGNAFGITGNCRDIRATLIERAELIRDWGVDPILKGFISRVLDHDASDGHWIEGVAALITERPPPAWRDADRAKFELALTRVSRLFMHLEALAFTGTNSQQSQNESIRIGITRRNDPERERVIHMSPTNANEVRRIETLIESTLERGVSLSNKEVTLAALARVVEKLLEKDQERQIIHGNGHLGKV